MTARALSIWKERLDKERDFTGADRVVEEALSQATREELLFFLAYLFDEFRGDDSPSYGGAVGTLEWMKRINVQLVPSDHELNQVGIPPSTLRAFLRH